MIEILVYPADEVEKEIDGLMDNFKEMELQKDEKIEQLKKEKEWLIEAWADDVFIDDEFTPMKRLRSKILDKMQQALKDGK